MLQLTRLGRDVSPACYPAPSPGPAEPYFLQNLGGGCVTHFAAGTTLYCEDDAADQIYQVITGIVRTVTITREGKRALRGFHVPGEIFGIECTRSYRASAEAVCDARVLRRNRSAIERILASDEILTRHLLNSVLQISKRAEDLSLLGRATAIEKLSYFLLDLADRLGTMPGCNCLCRGRISATISAFRARRSAALLRRCVKKNCSPRKAGRLSCLTPKCFSAPRHIFTRGSEPRHMFCLLRIIEAGCLPPPSAMFYGYRYFFYERPLRKLLPRPHGSG